MKLGMDANSLRLPIYTSDEAKLKTKLQLGFRLSDQDYSTLANDLVVQFGYGVSLGDPFVSDYLQMKYPGNIDPTRLNLKLD